MPYLQTLSYFFAAADGSPLVTRAIAILLAAIWLAAVAYHVTEKVNGLRVAWRERVAGSRQAAEEWRTVGEWVGEELTHG